MITAYTISKLKKILDISLGVIYNDFQLKKVMQRDSCASDCKMYLFYKYGKC